MCSVSFYLSLLPHRQSGSPRVRITLHFKSSCVFQAYPQQANMPLITEQNRTPRTTRRSRQVAAGGFVSLCASPKKTEQGITITGLIPAGLVLVAFCYVFVWSQSVNQWAPFAVISAYLLLLDLLLPPSLVSDFAARKLCHAGCGFGIMLLDSRSELDKWFVWGVSAVSIGMTWDVVKGLPQFRFSRERDVGITIYLMAGKSAAVHGSSGALALSSAAVPPERQVVAYSAPLHFQIFSLATFPARLTSPPSSVVMVLHGTSARPAGAALLRGPGGGRRGQGRQQQLLTRRKSSSLEQQDAVGQHGVRSRDLLLCGIRVRVVAEGGYWTGCERGGGSGRRVRQRVHRGGCHQWLVSV